MAVKLDSLQVSLVLLRLILGKVFFIQNIFKVRTVLFLEYVSNPADDGSGNGRDLQLWPVGEVKRGRSPQFLDWDCKDIWIQSVGTSGEYADATALANKFSLNGPIV